MRRALALVTVAAAAYSAVPAAAVHESHHGPFVGRTAQDERLVMRVTSHTRIGIRFRWRGECDQGTIVRIARVRHVPVSDDGRFFKRSRTGIGVRGKIGLDPQGNPAPPEPFSFANNEARGRLRVAVEFPGRGVCRTGLVTWKASR